MIYQLKITPYFDKPNSCYKDIITINKMPESPLGDIVKKVQYYKPSPFTETSNCGCNTYTNCLYGFILPKTTCLATNETIDELISYLYNIGYSIENNITKVMNRSDYKPKGFLFYIKK